MLGLGLDHGLCDLTTCLCYYSIVLQAVEMLRNRVFLPTPGVTLPRTDFDWKRHNLRLQLEPEPFPDDKRVVVGVNSFGIGK